MLDIIRFLERNFEVVDTYGNPPSDYRVDCPFCGTRTGSFDTKRHLYISMTKSTVHCFRCGYASTWIGMVIDYTGKRRDAAISELYRKPTARAYNEMIGHIRQSIELSPHARFCNLPADYQLITAKDPEARIYRGYLKWRGFDAYYWQRYQLGYTTLSEVGRVIIPIEEDYWQARAINNYMKPKYKNPKIASTHYIFNSPALELYDEVVICEGAFSAMAVGDNAVAIVGKEATNDKIERLQCAPVDHYIIALEPFAWGTVRKLAQALYRSNKAVSIWKFSRGDPADPQAQFVEMPYNTRTMLELNFEN